jgi:hypothetical protein
MMRIFRDNLTPDTGVARRCFEDRVAREALEGGSQNEILF